jgi:diaminopropionate ammonia-lyase
MGHMTSWYFSSTARDWTCPSSLGDAHAFHQSLPGYAPTPLVPVPEVATELEVGRVLLKDESSRLGLPAFKVLGASWACRQMLQ